MQVKIFKYLFYQENSADKFVELVNKETDGFASHPYSGRSAELDRKAVMVKGVGSTVFDIQLKAMCDKLCLELGGCPMPSTT